MDYQTVSFMFVNRDARQASFYLFKCIAPGMNVKVPLRLYSVFHKPAFVPKASFVVHAFTTFLTYTYHIYKYE